MPAGRPSEYDPAYCARAIEFLKDGYSLAAFAGEIGVSRQTVYNWGEQHPEFLDAVKRGQAAAVLWWEKRNRELAQTGDGNATAIIFGLKNRATEDWRDKHEVEHSGNFTVVINKPGAEIQEIVLVDPIGAGA